MINDIIAEQVKRITQKKEMLIKERIIKYLNIEVDLEAEYRRRFPRIKCEHDTTDQSEHFYWNDGTETGIRIISFYPQKIDWTGNNIKTGYDYL